MKVGHLLAATWTICCYHLYPCPALRTSLAALLLHHLERFDHRHVDLTREVTRESVSSDECLECLSQRPNCSLKRKTNRVDLIDHQPTEAASVAEWRTLARQLDLQPAMKKPPLRSQWRMMHEPRRLPVASHDSLSTADLASCDAVLKGSTGAGPPCPRCLELQSQTRQQLDHALR